jgi:hypothetical protein
MWKTEEPQVTSQSRELHKVNEIELDWRNVSEFYSFQNPNLTQNQIYCVFFFPRFFSPFLPLFFFFF